MTRTMTILCAAASATVSALALCAAPASAGPLSAPLAATSADIQSTEAVRDDRRHHSRRGGPRAYYGSGYNSYAFGPGYAGRRYGGSHVVATPARGMRTSYTPPTRAGGVPGFGLISEQRLT